MKKFKKFLRSLGEILKRPEMEVLPGQLAYFFIMSLVPAITIVSYAASFLSLSLDDMAAYFNWNINSGVMSLLTPVLETNEFHIGLIVLFIICTYFVSNGTNSIIVTANSVYGIKSDSFLRRRIKSIIMVFIIVFLFLFIFLVPVFGNFILSLIEQITGYNKIYNVINILKLPLSWLVIFVFIKIIYTVAPDKAIESKHVNPGALFTSIGWVVSTEVYLYYASHFANYNPYFSGLSNIAILLIWMYILSVIFVIGMAINHKKEPSDNEVTKKSQNNIEN